MEPHQLANMFPDMDGEQFQQLKSDIQANDLLEPVTTYQGSILDGKHRHKACSELGTIPKTVDLEPGTDPLQFVISKNLHRRHLVTSQRSMIAAELANLSASEKKNGNTGKITLQEAADMMSVSKANVSKAVKLKKVGTKDEIEAVRQGKATVEWTLKKHRSNNRTQPAPKPKKPRKLALYSGDLVEAILSWFDTVSNKAYDGNFDPLELYKDKTEPGTLEHLLTEHIQQKLQKLAKGQFFVITHDDVELKPKMNSQHRKLVLSKIIRGVGQGMLECTPLHAQFDNGYFTNIKKSSGKIEIWYEEKVIDTVDTVDQAIQKIRDLLEQREAA